MLLALSMRYDFLSDCRHGMGLTRLPPWDGVWPKKLPDVIKNILCQGLLGGQHAWQLALTADQGRCAG